MKLTVPINEATAKQITELTCRVCELFEAINRQCAKTPDSEMETWYQRDTDMLRRQYTTAGKTLEIALRYWCREGQSLCIEALEGGFIVSEHHISIFDANNDSINEITDENARYQGQQSRLTVDDLFAILKSLEPIMEKIEIET